MTTSIRPGDSLSLRCPEGTESSDQVGQFFPDGSKEKFFSIVSKNKNEVIIGPLKTGEYEVSTRCSDGSTQRETISLKALSQQEMPDAQPMAPPFLLGYPLWLWLLGFFLVSLLTGGILWLKNEIKKRRARKNLSPGKAVSTGQELLENFLKNAQSEKWAPKNDPQTLAALYSTGYDCTRAFLEHKLHFKASWATSSEFLGSLKSSLIGYSNLGSLTHDVESVLHQSDLVRFSKDVPPEAARINYLNTIKKIFDIVVRITRSEEGQSENTESGE